MIHWNCNYLKFPFLYKTFSFSSYFEGRFFSLPFCYKLNKKLYHLTVSSAKMISSKNHSITSWICWITLFTGYFNLFNVIMLEWISSVIHSAMFFSVHYERTFCYCLKTIHHKIIINFYELYSFRGFILAILTSWKVVIIKTNLK